MWAAGHDRWDVIYTVFYHDIADDYFALLAEEAHASNTDMPELNADGQRYYTTMMSLCNHHGFYRQHHLAPFGEFCWRGAAQPGRLL